MEFRNRGRRRSGMSFYMALGLCVAAVCLIALSTMINRQQRGTAKDGELTEWVADETAAQSAENIYPGEVFAEDGTQEGVSDGTDGISPEADTTPFRHLQEEDSTEENTPQQNEKPKAEDEREREVVAASAEAVTAAEDESVAAASAALAMPVSGQIIKPYSGTELVFCQTLGDWRVHEGLDIAADAGGEVRCAAPGVVMDFVEDPLYGYSVAVNQDDDAIIYYCGLSSTCMVSPGMKVSAGDVIGYVGEVPCEASDGSHIHIAMMRDGQFTDPAKYMGE